MLRSNPRWTQLCSNHSNTRPRRSFNESTLSEGCFVGPSSSHRPLSLTYASAPPPGLSICRTCSLPPFAVRRFDSACNSIALLEVAPTASRPSWKLCLSRRLLHLVAFFLLLCFLFVTPLLLLFVTGHPSSNYRSWSPFSRCKVICTPMLLKLLVMHA
ncbi:hypothetical protein SCHPADRAFT_505616 [Schizopora paradoxa]|uniref:Uncharacterized protein n=1 Tax=Schizopora paradoxa TaxID=27342 RepID=A0A0H2S0Z2_9AGAM|nr:hypothetical protein SCHPADRAFT_505616 [Schizopora paradoxa]